MNQVVEPPLSPALPRPAYAARGLYIGLALLMSAIVLWGFWPFYSSLASGTSEAHWVVYVHAAVFTGWMALLVTQASLVYRRQVRAHQGLGRVGIHFGALVLATGLMVSFIQPGLAVESGRMTLDEAAGFLILPFGDLALFVGFFAAAIHYRRRTELHKRLILLATVALIFPAAARAAWAWGPAAVMAVWLAPLVLAMAHDKWARGRVERVYYIGFAIFVTAMLRIGLMESETWIAIAKPLVIVPG